MSHSRPSFVGTPQTLRANRDTVPQNAPETSDRAFGFCQIIAAVSGTAVFKKAIIRHRLNPFRGDQKPRKPALCLIRSPPVGTPYAKSSHPNIMSH